MSDPLILKTDNLCASFGKQQVLHNVSLNVPEGRIYGFLGRNGAGKSTTIRIILRLLKPTSGTVRLLGYDSRHYYGRALLHVGSLVEAPGFYDHLSGPENLRIATTLRKLPERAIGEALELAGLTDVSSKPVGHYSMGMRQRLGLAWALLGMPKLLILDEPINGLDPAGVREVRNLLRYLSTDKGMSIFLSSHILSEVQQVADRIGVIHTGRLLVEKDCTESAFDDVTIKIRCDRAAQAAEVTKTLAWVSSASLHSQDQIQVRCTKARCAELNRVLVQAGFAIAEFTWVQEDLEDYFLQLTDSVPSSVS
jgi:ABC-type multidrug transport system ATPase subunit